MYKYFIVGTDTDCGKTYVTGQLMHNLQTQGYTVRALKPIASGCRVVADKLVNDDVQNILNNDKSGATSSDVCNWLFNEPIAPHIAAFKENVDLDAVEIAKFCQRPELNNFDYVLIEGAGGLMVPLNYKQTWLDFLDIIKVPVIVVVGMRLGCINHALLTIDVLKNRNIKIAGWVANCIDPNMLCLDENIETIKTMVSERLLGVISYNGYLESFNLHDGL